MALLAGASLLFDNRPRSRARPSEVMILCAGLLAFAAIVGAAFGAGPLYRVRTAPITGVAVPTAVGLLLISAGMFLERPAAGVARLATLPGPGGALLRRLVLPGMVLPALLAFALSRAFTVVGVQDVALLFATLVALTTVGGLVLLVISAAPLDRAHTALAASRVEMRELFQQAPDGIFVADLEGRYTDVNRAGCEMLGYAREEIVGKTIVDLIPAEDVGRLAASKQHLLAGKAEVSEWRLLRKDGTQLPVELNAKILPDGRWQAFVRDISERRRIEDERQVFVSLLENSSDFIGIADPSGKPIYLNPAGRRMVGLPADFPVEKVQIVDCYPAEERAFAADVILKTMVERGRWSGETYFRHWQTEEAIPVSDEHFMIRDPSGAAGAGHGDRHARHLGAQARREGAAVPGRGRGGAGVVARLRADAGDPGAADGSRVRRLVHRRHRRERQPSAAAQGHQRARQPGVAWPPGWSGCRSIGVCPTSPGRSWTPDGRS